jgi:hypothetical protein
MRRSAGTYMYVPATPHMCGVVPFYLKVPLTDPSNLDYCQ